MSNNRMGANRPASSLSRRGFLASTAAGAAGIAIGGRPLHALTLSGNAGRVSGSANTYFDRDFDHIATADLNGLATQAVDAAKSAGASYADARVAATHELHVVLEIDGPHVYMFSQFHYGVRALVNGAWAFVHGTVPTSDAITAQAKNAVATARGYAGQMRQRVELAPTPVVTGEWTSPMKIDPFTVPMADPIDLVTGIVSAAGRVLGAGATGKFRWLREVRSFASSEGSLVTQTFCRARPSFKPGAKQTFLPGLERILSKYQDTTAGYECVLVPDLQEHIEAAAERMALLSTLPVGGFDVGRYPVVFDGVTLAALFGRTLGQALQLDRAIGRENDASGSSYLAPPEQVLGTTVVNPLLTVTASRALPCVNAVRWDDEGVAAEDFTLMRDGVVVDYATSRDSAGILAPWYQRSGQRGGPRGCAFAKTAGNAIDIRLPNVTVAPATDGPTIETLYKDMHHGLLMANTSYLSTDHQLASGALLWPTEVYEIRRGTIVRRVRGTGVQFMTQKLWKNLTALGGPLTVDRCQYDVYKGNPWRFIDEETSAPAGLVKDVDVIGTERRLG
jgi:TldD protein